MMEPIRYEFGCNWMFGYLVNALLAEILEYVYASRVVLTPSNHEHLQPRETATVLTMANQGRNEQTNHVHFCIYRVRHLTLPILKVG